jgi:hypothetical protein
MEVIKPPGLSRRGPPTITQVPTAEMKHLKDLIREEHRVAGRALPSSKKLITEAVERWELKRKDYFDSETSVSISLTI